MTRVLDIVVVDDEPLARKGLRLYLDDRDDFNLVAECESGTQALNAITKHDPDVVLLDIQMPGKDGIDVVKALQGDHMPLIVFVTAYNHYAIEAFEVKALDYILKPVDPLRLNETLDRCKQLVVQQRRHNKKGRLLALCESDSNVFNEEEMRVGSSSSAEEQILNIRDGKNLFRFKYENIFWIESAGDYICVHTERENAIIKSTLKNLETQLSNSNFLRIHRSTIINTRQVYTVCSLANGEFQIELQNGKKLRSGRTYKNDVRELFKAQSRN